MLTKQCDLIEQLESAHKFHQRNAQIRKLTGRGNNAGVTRGIEDRDGNIIMEQEKILERWHEYISTLYDDARGGIPLISNDTKLSPITRTEMEYALILKGMPMRKAPGPNDITTEMLVAAGGSGVTEITNLANMMYSEGRFPEQMYESIFITIAKVKRTAKCEKHRTISLMSHVTKLQTTQPTSGGAVTADSSCCANCVESSRPRFTVFLAYRPYGSAGWLSLLLTKAGRDQSRSDKL